MTHVTRPSRRGYTLIELLVVIVIIGFLLSLAVLVAPRFSDSQKSALGASKLQGWLAVAKQRAFRDKIVCGVRLYRASGNSADPDYQVVRTFEYIEQPPDFTSGTLACPGDSSDPTNQAKVRLSVAANNAIQVGDLLYITGDESTGAHYINNVQVTGNTTLLTLGLLPAPNNNPVQITSSAASYRIIRQPRTTGEPELTMPSDMVVWLPRDLPTANPVDVLFKPAGGAFCRDRETNVITDSGKVIFWVRDITRDTDMDGEPTLITVYMQTGAVAAHPVNKDSSLGDPYIFTRDGRNAGL